MITIHDKNKLMMDKILYLNNPIFKPTIFGSGEHSFSKKVEFIFSFLIFGGLLYWMIPSIYYGCVEGLISIWQLFCLSIICLLALYPITLHHRRIYKRMLMVIFYKKKIRLLKYINYLNTLNKSVLINTLINDKDLPNDSKAAIESVLVLKLLMPSTKIPVEL